MTMPDSQLFNLKRKSRFFSIFLIHGEIGKTKLIINPKLEMLEFPVSHPTTSHNNSHHQHHHHQIYTPILATSSSYSEATPSLNLGKYRLIRKESEEDDDEEEHIRKEADSATSNTALLMAETITTDDSLCGDEDADQTRIRRMGSVSKPISSIVISARGANEDGGSSSREGIDAIVGDSSGSGQGRWRRAEWVKGVFLFVFLLVSGMSNWAVIAYTHDYVPRHPLPDLVFSLIAEQRWASSLGDLCVALCIVILAVLLAVHQHRGTILKRVVFCAATLYAMRSLTLAATQLPSGYTDNKRRCRDQIGSTPSVFFQRLFEQTIRIGFQSKEQMLCGDLLFSGHTLVMVTCSLAVAYYLPKSVKPLQWFAHIACFIGMLCMIISRTHYTIDVIIAYWLSNMVFRIYHAYCELDMCMERHKSILYSWWPCRIVDWLEQDIVPGRLDNRFSLPWKQRRRRAGTSRQERGGASGGESSDSSVATNSTSSHHHPHHQKHISISSSSTYPLPC